jgi:glycosyltransferase involved in cell wall biosynthesis
VDGGTNVTRRQGTTISVVIPAKDDADLLERCLLALARQSRLADEIVVVDNNSTDDTADRARRFGASVISETAIGIPAAAAAGYDRATGDIIARLDADCIPPMDWLEQIERSLAENPDAVAVTNGAYFIDGPRWFRSTANVVYLGAYFALVYFALGHPPLFGSNFGMRRSGWEAVRGAVHRFDAMVHDDLDLSFHLGPERAILRDRRLGMGISMRPFFDGRGGVRLVRGLRSVVIHWPAELPMSRFVRARRRRLARGAGSL